MLVGRASQGVRVNVVEPGWIASDMTAAVSANAARRTVIEDATALSRLGANYNSFQAHPCSPRRVRAR
jgi:NAD(P)-dependent dehydrogenase (short-subunit alcohol dehydrogenase family)